MGKNNRKKGPEWGFLMKKTLYMLLLTVLLAGVSSACAENPGSSLPAGENTHQFPESTPSPSAPPASNFNPNVSLPNIGANGGSAGVNPMLKHLGEGESFSPPPFDVAFDFTAMSAEEFDRAYSNIFVMHGDDYIGKTVRVVGPYSGFFYDEFDRYFHFVLLEDVDECCILHVEFMWSDSNTPGELPEENAIIDISGVLQSYYTEEWDQTDYYLVVESISILGGIG
jgi:hypothetical protein